MDHQDINLKNEEITNDNNQNQEDSNIKSNNINNSDIKNIENDHMILEKKLLDLNNKYLLLAADFDNYKKRCKKQIEDIKKYSLESIMTDLLEVIDNFERAISSFDFSKDKDIINSTKEGIIKINKQFITILKTYGVKKITTDIGSEFDPYYHEAIQYINTKNQKDNTIYKIVKEGYLLDSKVLRPTTVVVTKNDIE